MVAELLRLNARLALGALRSSPWLAARTVVELLVAGAVLVLLYAGALALAQQDAALVRRVAVIAGSALSLAVFAVPAFAARPEALDRRALRGYGIRPAVLALALLVVGLAGPLALLVVPLAALPLAVWAEPVSWPATLLVCALLVLQLALGWRLGRAAGAALATRPRSRFATRAAIVLVGIATLAVLGLTVLARVLPFLSPGQIELALPVLRRAGELGLARVPELLAATPLGALWAAPAPGRLGDPSLTGSALAIGALTVLLLAVLWIAVVRADFRVTWRTRAVRKRGVPGWFRGFSSTPLGAATARSFSYWARDPRYRAVLVFLPAIPIVTLLAFWIGGVPFELGVLLPLPLMLLVLAWSTLHNDVAYDSTALWSLLAAQLDGRADRLGRATPVLVLGGILLAVGAPLTVWGHRDLAIAPVVLGVGIAILLGAVGVASIASVRSPYPAPRPGDSAFQQPVLAGSAGGDAQAGSLVLTLLTAAPAVAAGIAWLAGFPGPWNWVALTAGLATGGATFLLGVRAGARVFDRAGPELLAFTMRN